MGRTLRKSIKNSQNAPFLTYLIRKWKQNVDEIKESTPKLEYNLDKRWADSDEDELPELPAEWLLPPPPENAWVTPHARVSSSIRKTK